eukprot:scaffold2914_cov178-Amphora_coffeaeformis.AAC.10
MISGNSLLQVTRSASSQARCFLHCTPPRRVSYNRPGQGGQSEERFIAQALRKMRDNPSELVVEVMNARHVDIAARYLPTRRQPGQAWLRILTHADSLSQSALAYQMQRASQLEERHSSRSDRQQPEIPVIAVNLKDAESLKTKSAKPIQQFLAMAQEDVMAARKLQQPQGCLVCGLPNAGKSSLIHCLTKARTLQVRKKKSYHLPKISASPGWTLGSKSHTFEFQKNTYALTDTPGLRPRMESLDERDVAYLVATGTTQIVKGMFQTYPGLEPQVVEILWQGLKRHADLSNKTIPFDSCENLKTSHSRNFPNVESSGLVQHLINHCLDDGYGGMVIERKPRMGAETQGDASAMFSSDVSVVVAMNKAAKRLQDGGGMEMQEAVKTAPAKAVVETSQNHFDTKHSGVTQEDPPRQYHQERRQPIKPFPSTEEDPPPQHQAERRQPTKLMRSQYDTLFPKATLAHSHPKQSNKIATIDDDGVVRYPEHMRNFRCLICAGFLKSKPYVKGQNEDGYIIKHESRRIVGTRFTKVLIWSDDDIRCFYSRVLEAFGVNLNNRFSGMLYLMRDSLVRTFGAKYKKKSKRKIHIKMGVGRDLGGFPVPNEERPRRFQNDRPLPLRIFCSSRSRSGCRSRPDYVEPKRKSTQKS